MRKKEKEVFIIISQGGNKTKYCGYIHKIEKVHKNQILCVCVFVCVCMCVCKRNRQRQTLKNRERNLAVSIWKGKKKPLVRWIQAKVILMHVYKALDLPSGPFSTRESTEA